MTNPTQPWHPFARTRGEDLAILSAGGETGWWDDNGRPAPWPEDFLDPEAGWTTSTTIDDDNQAHNQAENDPENQPY